MHIHIAVPRDYFNTRSFPTGAYYGDEAMADIWRLPLCDVQFIRNDHPLGDLYRVKIGKDDILSPEDILAYTLRFDGTIITDFYDKKGICY